MALIRTNFSPQDCGFWFGSYFELPFAALHLSHTQLPVP